MEKRGGTTGVLYQRASEKGERERTGYVRPKIHRDTALRHRRRELDTDTERRERINICINKMTNKSNNPQWGAGRLQPNRPANRCRCLFVNAQKRGRLEVLPEAHGHSSEQREPPETCTERSYGAMEEREAFGLQSDSTLSSLRAIPFSPSFSLFLSAQ